MNTRIRQFFSISSGFFLFLWFHLGTRMGEFAKDPGVGWHLAAGQWVLDHQSVPREDPFLAYSPALRWVSDQWAADTMFASIFHLFGWAGLYNLCFFLYLSAFLLIVYPISRRRSESALAALVATLFASKPAEIHFILRPVLFGFFFMALLGRFLPQLSRSSGVSDRRIMGGLFLLFLVWSNIHPSFAYGFVLVALYVGTMSLGEWVIEKQRSGLPRAIGIVSAALAGSLCNPYGWRLHESIFSLGASKLFMRLHQEWMPLDILEPEGFFFGLFASVILVGMWIRAARGQRVLPQGVAEAVVLAVAARAGFAHLRMIPYFFILAAPLFASSLRIVAQAIGTTLSDSVPGLEKRFQLREQREAARASPILIASLLFVVSVGSTPLGRVAGFPTTRAEQEIVDEGGGALPDRLLSIPLGPPANRYPYRGLDYLRSVQESLRESPDHRDKAIVVLNPPDWGGFIALYGGDAVRPLFDDRNTLLGESRYLSYFRVANSCGGLMRLAQELKADFLMIPAWDLKIPGCIIPPVDGEDLPAKPGQVICEGNEPCFGEPALLQRANYRDAIAAIFRVPPPSAKDTPPVIEAESARWGESVGVEKLLTTSPGT